MLLNAALSFFAWESSEITVKKKKTPPVRFEIKDKQALTTSRCLVQTETFFYFVFFCFCYFFRAWRGTLPATLRRRPSLNIDHTSTVLFLTGQTDSAAAIFGLLCHISSAEGFFFSLSGSAFLNSEAAERELCRRTVGERRWRRFKALLWDSSAAAFGSERSVELGFCSPRTFPYSTGTLPQRFLAQDVFYKTADSHVRRMTTKSLWVCKSQSVPRTLTRGLISVVQGGPECSSKLMKFNLGLMRKSVAVKKKRAVSFRGGGKSRLICKIFGAITSENWLWPLHRGARRRWHKQRNYSLSMENRSTWCTA